MAPSNQLEKRAQPVGWSYALKDGCDRVLAALGLVVLAPLLVLIGAAVAVSSPGGVFFRRERIGRNGRAFTMLKFRTMTGDPESCGEADASWAAASLDAPGRPAIREVTAVGRVLRALCLDELPQLVHVVRGDMALVGPRPERIAYADRFTAEIPGYGDRHRVKPGITGWAQVNGLRGETSLTDRVEFDNFYIDNWSLLLDARIMLATPRVIGRLFVKALRPALAPHMPEHAHEIVEPEERALLAPR